MPWMPPLAFTSSEKLEGLQADFADAGAAARQWVDITDFESLLRHHCSAEHRQREGSSHHEFAHVIPP